MRNIKYLYSSFRAAQIKGSLNEYLFFLQLKSLSKSGVYYKHIYLKSIANSLPYSKSYISTLIKRLIKLGYIRETKTEYQLVSIFSVWRKLGYRFKHKTYCEQYRIDVIPAEYLLKKDLLKTYITSIEVIQSQRNQLYHICKKIKDKIEYHQNTILKVRNSKIWERKRQQIEHLTQQLKDYTEGLQSGCKTVAQLSCKKLSSILGYKTSMTAWRYEQKAQDSLLLNVVKSVQYITEVSLLEFNLRWSEFENCYWRFGKVYRKKCNQLFFGPSFQYKKALVHFDSIKSNAQ